MSRQYQDDFDDSRRGRNDRDRSPDYYSGGGGSVRDYDDARSRGSRHEEPFQREEMTLMPPAANHRTRSVPPNADALVYRDRSPSPDDYPRSRGGRSRSSSRSTRRSRRTRDGSPMSRARNAMEDNFTNSKTGLGASFLGAVVGGIAANRASDAALKNRDKKHHQRRHSEENAMPRAVSTILGAVVGGLGANAIANRVEDSRDRDRHKQSWDGRHSSHRGDDYDDYDDRRYDDRRYDDRRYDDRRYDDDRSSRHHGQRDYY